VTRELKFVSFGKPGADGGVCGNPTAGSIKMPITETAATVWDIILQKHFMDAAPNGRLILLCFQAQNNHRTQ
jgi:hypothetical protein